MTVYILGFVLVWFGFDPRRYAETVVIVFF